MTLAETFKQIKTIAYSERGHEVEKTVSGLIQTHLAPQANLAASNKKFC